MFMNPYISAELARQRQREMRAWAGRCLWLAVRMMIRTVRMAHDEQVSMWECLLLTSGAAPLTAAGPLRWIASLGGYRLAGSHLPAQDPAKQGGNPGWRPRAKTPASGTARPYTPPCGQRRPR
jgi:hypothetical protein